MKISFGIFGLAQHTHLGLPPIWSDAAITMRKEKGRDESRPHFSQTREPV